MIVFHQFTLCFRLLLLLSYYLVFCVFLLAKPIVTILGPQRGLLYGMTGYSIYVGGFLFAIIFKDIFVDLSWLVACVAAVIGGIAGGLLWTAQGTILPDLYEGYVNMGMYVHTHMAVLCLHCFKLLHRQNV